MARNYDGKVTIGFDIDTKELENGIRESERRLKQFQREGEQLSKQKIKTEADVSEMEAGSKIIEQEFDKEIAKAREVKASQKDINEMMQNKAQIMSLVNAGTEEYKQDLNSINEKLKENARNQEQTTEEITRQKEQLKQSNAEMARAEYLQNGYKNISEQIKDIVKRVTHWGLALIGIGSIYAGLRRAVSMVSAQNAEIANSFEQIRNVIAGALLPIAQKVINIIVKVMVYINYLFKVLTGRNLFNFADATKKASDNLKSGAGSSGAIAKNMKEARKQLAAFDEMNILQDNVAGSGGGGGGAGGIGGIDADDFGNIFDKIKNIKIPKWLEKLGNILKELKKHWKELLIIIGAVGAAFLALKIAGLIASLGKFAAITATVKAGIALLVAGLVMLIGGVVNAIWNWDEMSTKGKILNGVIIALGATFTAVGIALIAGFSALTLALGLAVAAIVLFTTGLVTSIVKGEQEATEMRDVTKQTKLLKQAKEDAKKAYDELIEAVDRQAEAQKRLKEAEKESGYSGKELYKQVENGTLTYQKMNEKQRETYKAYKDLVQANKDVKKAEEEKMAADSLVVKKEFDVRVAAEKTGKGYQQLKDDVLKAWKEGKISTQDATDTMSRMMGRLGNKGREVFAQDLPDDIKKGLDPGKYRGTLNKVYDIFVDKFSKIKNKVNDILGKIKTKLKIDAEVSTSKKKKSAKGAILTYPKLAVGGIVNRPGSGVVRGGAIIGERGAEGVIPLTDSQQMMLLGEAIGKFITVNANITNTMNGRVISRELQKIQNDDNFAYNR